MMTVVVYFKVLSFKKRNSVFFLEKQVRQKSMIDRGAGNFFKYARSFKIVCLVKEKKAIKGVL